MTALEAGLVPLKSKRHPIETGCPFDIEIGGGLKLKKAPDFSGALCRIREWCLDPFNVGSLKAFRTLDHVERYVIAFS